MGLTMKLLISAFLLLLCLAANAAVDNNPRVVRLRGFKGLWLAPSNPTSFTNNGPITIIDASVASPYPSSITVPNVSGVLLHITVVLNNMSHTFPDDCDILLSNPQGTNIVLMSDCGGNATHPISNVTLVFTDTATTPLPDSTQIVSGTYAPTNYGAGDPFLPPAPSTGLTTTFNDFLGLNPSGVWSLWVVDDQGGDAGSIAGGFSLIFEYQ